MAKMTRDEIKEVLREAIDDGVLVDELIAEGYDVDEECTDNHAVDELYEDVLDLLATMFDLAQKKS